MNKKLFYFILIISTLVLLTSCAPQITPPPTPPPTPQYCTVIVTSQRADVWGQAVYMDGNPMPNTILAPWGSAQINNVTVGVRHSFMIIQGNTFSTTMYVTTVPGINYVDFYTW